MRRVPSHCETIRIVPVSGEAKDFRASGFARVQLRWLFRNFGLLHFSVLNESQQQLITKLWHVEPETAPETPAGALIGTIEGFSPESCPQPPIAARNRMRQSPAHQHSFRAARPVLLALGIVLVTGAFILWAKHRPMGMHNSAAHSDGLNNVESLNNVDAAALRPPVASQSAPRVPGFVSNGTSSPADSHAGENGAVTVPPLTLPALASKKPLPATSREIVIRASIDNEGRGYAFEVLRGDQNLTSVALGVARQWRFQPCSRAEGCEQLLKYTDYGGATSMRVTNE